MHEACVEALKKCENKLKPGNKAGEVFDMHMPKPLINWVIKTQE